MDSTMQTYVPETVNPLRLLVCLYHNLSIISTPCTGPEVSRLVECLVNSNLLVMTNIHLHSSIPESKGATPSDQQAPARASLGTLGSSSGSLYIPNVHAHAPAHTSASVWPPAAFRFERFPGDHTPGCGARKGQGPGEERQDRAEERPDRLLSGSWWRLYMLVMLAEAFSKARRIEELEQVLDEHERLACSLKLRALKPFFVLKRARLLLLQATTAMSALDAPSQPHFALAPLPAQATALSIQQKLEEALTCMQEALVMCQRQQLSTLQLTVLLALGEFYIEHGRTQAAPLDAAVSAETPRRGTQASRHHSPEPSTAITAGHRSQQQSIELSSVDTWVRPTVAADGVALQAKGPRGSKWEKMISAELEAGSSSATWADLAQLLAQGIPLGIPITKLRRNILDLMDRQSRHSLLRAADDLLKRLSMV